MRISDLSSDVCNGDAALALFGCLVDVGEIDRSAAAALRQNLRNRRGQRGLAMVDVTDGADVAVRLRPLKFSLSHVLEPSRSLWLGRSEEHTSELQSLMRISYSVFCFKKK